MKKICAVLLAATSVAACTDGLKSGDDTTGTGSGSATGSDTGSATGSADQYQQILDSRVVDYGAALRIAAVRLTGDLPTMTESHSVTDPTDPTAQKTAYEALITDYLTRPTFATQMMDFWRDTFKQGGTAMLDTAPALAAQLSTTNGSYMNLFTQSSGNCPTFDATTGTFTAAECGNGGPIAGVLTNPGIMSQFFSNFGFRRVRFIQEIFDCTAFPAEVTSTPVNVGGTSPYTSPWPFTSVATTKAGGAGRIDFQDTSAIICANCHTTINHIAPLFAYYDMNGAYQTKISVPTPLVGAPPAQLTDYLTAGETTAWRFGVQAADIPALGADMAADPLVAQCGVARMWNWALGKQDIVDSLETVPADVIATQTAAFTANGYKIRDMIFSVYTADDFVKF